MSGRRTPYGGDANEPKYHRRQSDDPATTPPIPHRRATDLSLQARVKAWSGVIAAIMSLGSFFVIVFVALGGQYIMPNDRVTKNELRITVLEGEVKEIRRTLDTTQSRMLDSVTKMLAKVDGKVNLLTVSRCAVMPVRPPRLAAVCDSLAELVPFR